MRLFLLLLIPVFAYASPAEEPEETTIPILETTQRLLGGEVNTVANRLDLFFADQRADDELARSRIRVRQSFEVRDRELLEKDTQFRINLRLPKLEERFKFELEKSLSEEEKEEKVKKEAKKDVRHAGLNTDWQFRADLGVNATLPPQIFTRGRFRKNWETGEVVHRFVEELSWFSDRDWEQNTSLDSDIDLDDSTLLRFGNSSDWKITRKDFSTSHGPGIRHRLSDDDAIAFGVGMSTIVDDGVWFVTNYRASITYRRNLYKQWIYVDLVPGIDFPKRWSFRRTPFIQLQLEALFGGFD